MFIFQYFVWLIAFGQKDREGNTNTTTTILPKSFELLVSYGSTVLFSQHWRISGAANGMHARAAKEDVVGG